MAAEWRIMPTETPPLAAHDCEIPAYAGMVFGGTGELWANSANCGTRHCEIPAYAGMSCGGTGELWAYFGHCGRRFAELSPAKCKNTPTHSRPPPKNNAKYAAELSAAAKMPKIGKCGRISRMSRRILITAALPYANGDIHLGHLVEYIQADIWARYHKLRGRECYFVCADDAHGTPVMLRAEAEKVAPEELIERMRESHLRDFSAFHINFDNYHSTHSVENEVLAVDMFRRLMGRGCIGKRRILQWYDERRGMFLPDRYIRGDCPKCGAAEQYGDSCERCGTAYSAMELQNPRSVLSGDKPVLRESEHYFLRLNMMRAELKNWTQGMVKDPEDATKQLPRLQKEAANKLREWLEGDLRDWDISRDAPYFGFRIPDIDAEKYFYVWLDAPIGYMASFQNFCDVADVCFDDFWRSEDKTELYHFIGKDILYFHALFWQAMLHNAGYRRPTRIFAHGFLTINGEKMSKSRGTFITAADYLRRGLSPEFLRYYYACKLGERMEDLDLSLADFIARTNGDLIGKLINIPSRVGGFVSVMGELDAPGGKHFAAIVQPLLDIEHEVAAAYESRRYQDAMRLLMHAADTVNAHIHECAPWKMAKDGDKKEELRAVVAAAIRAFHLLMTMLQPVLPKTALAAAQILNTTLCWENNLQPLPEGHIINPYRHLLKRMNDTALNALVQTPAADVAKPAAAVAAKPAAAATIGIEDFVKIDLRVATVVEAHEVIGADKLLRLILDVGDGRPRQVFAGIRQHVVVGDLCGRRVIYLSNLKTRTMRFGDSEGMVLAAADDSGLWLLSADAPAGTKVR